MPAGLDYKKKYLELRSKYIADLDMAFRLGVENGMQQANMQQAQESQQAAQNQLEAGGMAGEHAPKEEAQSPSDMMDTDSERRGSELDEHISKLENSLGSHDDEEVKKSVQAISSLRKAEKRALEMKKAEKAIQGISEALHKPSFKLGVQASHNLNDNAKQSLTLQHKIVNDVMDAWSKEEPGARTEIEKILNIENLYERE